MFAVLVDILVAVVGIWVGFVARCWAYLYAVYCPAMMIAAAVAAAAVVVVVVVVAQEQNIVHVAAELQEMILDYDYRMDWSKVTSVVDEIGPTSPEVGT